MTRKKVKLAWIVNDNARKASLKKRRVGLLKKVDELTTLCGVTACAVVYSPEDDEAAVWPSRPGVQQLLWRFMSLPEMDRSRKMVTQETYLKDRIAKVQDQLRKQQRKNKELEMSELMSQIFQGRGLDTVDMRELNGLAWLTGEKMKEIRKRIHLFQQIPHDDLPPPTLPPLPTHMAAVVEMGQTGGNGAEGIRTPVPPANEPVSWEQWFVEMINPNDNGGGSTSGGGNDIGQPHGNVGSSSGGNDLGSWANIFSP